MDTKQPEALAKPVTAQPKFMVHAGDAKVTLHFSSEAEALEFYFAFNHALVRHAQPVSAAPAQADARDAELAKVKQAYTELASMFHDQIVAQQAAWIEWQHGKGAEEGMGWIENGLCGPGHIPDEEAPYGTEAQAWFDANKSDPFPACPCGRPSNILWMGHGFCSNEHYDTHRAAIAAAKGA